MTIIGGVRLRNAMIVGAFGGIGAGFVFATAHALIIVPIWDRMLSGLVWAALAGAVGGWAYAELHPERAPTLRRGAGIGARFGALLWLSVAPVSLADAVLRATGVAPRLELLAVAVAVLLAILGGSLLGWVHTKSRRGTIAGAVAALVLTIAMAGPVPIGRNARAFGIFLAVLPAAIVAGAVLGSLISVPRGSLRQS